MTSSASTGTKESSLSCAETDPCIVSTGVRFRLSVTRSRATAPSPGWSAPTFPESVTRLRYDYLCPGPGVDSATVERGSDIIA